MNVRALGLTRAQAERADRLFSEGISFICHDHNLRPAELEEFRRSGVTAKQLHVSCDGQLWTDQETFWSSATPEQLRRERQRVGASDDDLPTLVDPLTTGVFLRSALVAIEHVYEQVEA